MDEFVQQAINGLSLGSTYALLALGLAIVFSILRLINFAHGELLTIGGYAMWVTLDLGIPWPLVIPITLAVTVLAAVAMERVAFRPLRGADLVTLLLTSFAISFLIRTVLGVAMGARARAVDVPEWLASVVNIGPYSVPLLQILTMAVTAVSLVALVLFLNRSTTGIALRAAAEDFSAVQMMGIRASRVVTTAFALSGLLAGVAALLYVARSGSIDPDSGLVPLVKAFIAVVIGGMGSLGGAVLGGFLLGLTEVSLQATLPDDVLPYRDAFALLVVIGILLVRPQGLMGGTRERIA